MKLTKKSRELMLFFSKNKHLNYDKQTNKTDTILLKLYDDIMEANIFLQKKKSDQERKNERLKNHFKIANFATLYL